MSENFKVAKSIYCYENASNISKTQMWHMRTVLFHEFILEKKTKQFLTTFLRSTEQEIIYACSIWMCQKRTANLLNSRVSTIYVCIYLVYIGIQLKFVVSFPWQYKLK